MGIERESCRIRNTLRQELPYCRFLKQMDLFILRDPIAAFCRPKTIHKLQSHNGISN
jgi:hypothetical protein